MMAQINRSQHQTDTGNQQNIKQFAAEFKSVNQTHQRHGAVQAGEGGPGGRGVDGHQTLLCGHQPAAGKITCKLMS